MLGPALFSLFCWGASLPESHGLSHAAPIRECTSRCPLQAGLQAYQGCSHLGMPSWTGLLHEEGPSTAPSPPPPKRPSSVPGIGLCISRKVRGGERESGKLGVLPLTSPVIRGTSKSWFPHLQMGLQDLPARPGWLAAQTGDAGEGTGQTVSPSRLQAVPRMRNANHSLLPTCLPHSLADTCCSHH